MKFNNKNLLIKYVRKYGIDNLFLKNMVDYMELLKFDQDEAIFYEGEELEYFYFLVEGKVKIYSLLKNGKQVLLRFIQPPGTLGEIELMGNYPVKNNAIATRESILIGIKNRIIEEKAMNDSNFLLYINKILSHKLYTIDKTMALNQTYPLKTRLASYLVTLSSAQERRVKEIKSFQIEDIAELLGSSVRHLNRVINDLRERDIIDKKNNLILIKNYDRLKELAKELYD